MFLEQFGWKEFFARQLPEGAVAGRVAAANRGTFVVWTAEEEIEAVVSGKLRHSSLDWPFVGDWVVLRQGAPVITGVLPRRTKLSRKQPGKEIREQVLAANVDVIFIVSGLDRDYNPRRMERYLLLAAESGARPVVLLNKADLASELDLDLKFIISAVRQLGVESVITLSAMAGEGLSEISTFLEAGETAALIGSSGVGKSTILNALLGDERQRTNHVRSDDDRGRHTTSRRELFFMPGGWLLIDLPGLRELHLWADPDQVETCFDDIRALAAHCRFRDCTHTAEPGCAVQSAELPPGRIANFRKLQRELEYLDRQENVQKRMEHKRKVKQLFRAYEKQTRNRIKF